jgi:hypothetical protein
MWIASAPSSSSHNCFSSARARSLAESALSFEAFEFRRDVALGVLQGLPAAVVVGNLFDVGVGDLDVKAMHLVELDLEIGDAAAVAFARFELDEEGAAVVLDRAQFVEVGVVARGDDAAFAHQRGRLGRDGVGQQADAGLRRCQRGDAVRRVAAAVSPAPTFPRMSSRRARLSRSEERSRGRALFRAMRAVMRSMSAKPARRLGQRGAGPFAGFADQRGDGLVAARGECSRSVSGWCRQWRSQREPMLVAQVSSSESRVGAGSPRRVSEISRLRRVAASRRR